MRYLVFSDVHANLEALNAVIAAGEERGVEAYLFLGDLIGYGPNPLECIQRLMELHDRGGLAWVAGNHELALLGEIEPVGYTQEALKTLAWTREQVEEQDWARKFLASAAMRSQVNEQIWLTHDSMSAPGGGAYHRHALGAKEQLDCLAREGGRICFYGHTHKMRVELAHGNNITLVMLEPHEADGVDPHPLHLGGADLAWVGAGSVGIPTNDKRRPEYMILQEVDDDWWLEKYTVAYDRARAKDRVHKLLTAPCGEAVANQIARWL
jgi:predicted phosphodiesterase